jgi:hypothetical protein
MRRLLKVLPQVLPQQERLELELPQQERPRC